MSDDMTQKRDMPQREGILRFAIWALIAATINIVLGKASIMAADNFLDGTVRTTVQFGIIASFAIGLLVLDRGYRRNSIPIRPLYITGVLCYLLVLFFVFLRILMFASAARGQMDL